MPSILAALLLLVPVAIVSGCATTEHEDAKLQTWIGRDLDDLVASMGSPSSSSQMPKGERQLTWSRRFSLSSLVPVESQGGAARGRVDYTRPIVSATTYWCNTEVTVDQFARITSIQQEGDGCE